MSFQFRFTFLLNLRRRQRDEAGAAVGQATEAIMKVDSQIDDLLQQQRDFQQSQDGQRVGSVSVDRMLSAGRYDLQLQADTADLRQTRVQLDQEFERRQGLLVVAQAEVKRFEQLEDRAKEEYRAEQLRLEQAEADDRSSASFLLSRRAMKRAAAMDANQQHDPAQEAQS